GSPRALCSYSLVLAERGNLAAAAQAFDQAMAAAPDAPEVGILRARRLLDTAGPLTALDALRAPLERRPGAAEGWYVQALCYGRQHNSRRAAYALDRAIRLDPRPAAYYREAA